MSNDTNQSHSFSAFPVIWIGNGALSYIDHSDRKVDCQNFCSLLSYAAILTKIISRSRWGLSVISRTRITSTWRLSYLIFCLLHHTRYHQIIVIRDTLDSPLHPQKYWYINLTSRRDSQSDWEHLNGFEVWLLTFYFIKLHPQHLMIAFTQLVPSMQDMLYEKYLLLINTVHPLWWLPNFSKVSGLPNL